MLMATIYRGVQFCSNMMSYSHTKQVYRLALIRSNELTALSFIDEILEKLRQYLDPRSIPILYHKIPTTTTPTVTNNLSKSSTQLKSNSPAPNTDAAQPSSEIPLTHNTIFYIGSESVGLTNLLMTNASSKVRLLFLSPHHHIKKTPDLLIQPIIRSRPS